jgi:Fanconi anemia group M protein
MEEIISWLEIRHIIVRDDDDPEVRSYIFHLRRDWQDFELPQEMKAFRQQLEDLGDPCRVFLEKHGVLSSNPQSLLWQDLEEERWEKEFPQRADLLPLYEKITSQTQKTKDELTAMTDSWLASRKRTQLSVLHAAFNQVTMLIRIWHMIDLLESYGVGPLRLHLLGLLDEDKLANCHPAIRVLVRNRPFQSLIAECDRLLASGIDHPKLDFLEERCRQWLAEGKFVLIFVRYRYGVDNTSQRFQAKGIDARAIMGGSKSKKALAERKQLLADFGERQFPILVSTQVIQQGIHVPAVDVVVCFDGCVNDIEWIQRRGRTARVKDGEVWCFFTRNNIDAAYFWSSRKKEEKNREKLQRILSQLEIQPRVG